MPKIVQFTHPGSEHSPDKRGGNHKSWNTGRHKRKFLLTNGDYVAKNELKEGSLVFWGEWEPPSHVEELENKPPKFFPRWIHRPYLPKKTPNSNGYQESYQNTDPCVFGDSFKYFVCKQFKPKNRTLTSLAKLDKGSLILFGSTANQNKENAFFQLDTVFVVSEHIKYDISDPNALLDLGNYRDFVFKMAFPQPSDYSLKLRLYKGASFENSVEKMYSFSPAKKWVNQQSSFARVPLKDMDYITNNLNAAPKITDASIVEVKVFWNKIVEISRRNGCVEGVKFNYEQE
jgi:hypothetical protein